jgi:septation ring formation regulator EzrA
MRVQNAAARPFDGRPFDASQIEGEIRETLQQRPAHIQAVETAPRPAKPQLPDYVNHRDDVSEIGKLSAEAIAREYEVTAKEIETMGEVVRDMVQRCEQLTTSASSMLKDIKATATRYRQEGKRIFDEIESCSSATDEVRKLCEGFRDKIAAKTAEGPG